jgi:acyl phosphate:glycerol-3-phosphate acyltransferase
VKPWLVVAGAYILGSIPWSYLIVRLIKGMDVRRVGSGNVGATNVLRTAGKSAGLAALALDAAKGVAAVWIAVRLGLQPAWVGAAAVAVVLGHVFPVFLGFRGGKGVATAAGALGTLAPWALLAAVVVFAAVVVASRYVSLGSICAVLVFPLALWLANRGGWPAVTPNAIVVAAAAVAALIVIKHQSNLRRLLAGTERRIGQPKENAA